MSCTDGPGSKDDNRNRPTKAWPAVLELRVCFVCVDNEHFATPEILIFSSKAPTAKEETPPLHLSPTRKDRLNIYNTEGMSE